MTKACVVGRGVGVVFAVGLAALSACAPKLMPTPSAITHGGVNPFEHVHEQYRTIDAPVFVATTREVSGDLQPKRYYSGKRSREIRLGMATVQMGRDLTWDELVELSVSERRRQQPVLAVESYEEFGPLWTSAWPPNMGFDRDWSAPGVDRGPAERFVEAVNATLDRSRHRDITVFVHGFNAKFAGNLAIAAEFWHFMGRDGVLVSFDWPSEGSMFSYEQDKANAEVAERQLRVLLEFLAANTDAARINVLGHSAGSPVVMGALRQLSLKNYGMDDEALRAKSKLGLVALAAPDMDLDMALAASVDGAGRGAEQFVVYASRSDRALGFSGNIFSDVRLGRSIGKLTEDEKAALIANDWQWVDVTSAQKRHSSFLGHSYFHQNPWVSSDLILLLCLKADEGERGLTRDEKTGFLVFPDDYSERLPELIAPLRVSSPAGP